MTTYEWLIVIALAIPGIISFATLLFAAYVFKRAKEEIGKQP